MLITQNGECSRIRYVNPSNFLIPYVISTVKILTETKRTPEWFLLRKFHITGTDTYGVWKLLSAKSIVLDENAADAVIKIFFVFKEIMKKSTHSLAVGDKHYGIEKLQSKILPERWIICRGKHQPTSGMKATIIEGMLSWLLLSMHLTLFILLDTC